MATQFSVNPMLASFASGTFSTQSDGVIQGAAFDDPAVRYALCTGTLDPTDTLPMWGGVPVQELIPIEGTYTSKVKRSTAIANVLAFAVVNQAHNWMTTPQNPVPVATAGMTVPYYRINSGARIPVKCDPTLANLDGGLATQQVTWDFNTNMLVPYNASTATVSVTSMTPTYSASLGGYTIAIVAAAAANVDAVGDWINISGATNTGTGGAALVNGTFQLTAFTDNQHFSIFIPAVSGAIGTIAGTIVLNEGVGALPVRVLSVQSANCKTISYNNTTGQAYWETNGCAAIILI